MSRAGLAAKVRPMQCVAAPSPNFDARPKDAAIDILLMHYTGMQSGAAAVARLCDPDSRVSSHYTVDEDGTVYQHVAEEYRAWHAGVSYWAGETNVNARSIGIEIVNPGHEFGYRAFPEKQIVAVMELARGILTRHRMPPERVLGHSDVAPARKQDPGEKFPWKRLAEAGIGLWPDKPAVMRGTFEANLRAFGYGVRPEMDVSLEAMTLAFQRHWRPHVLNGVPDAECEGILAALVAQTA